MENLQKRGADVLHVNEISEGGKMMCKPTGVIGVFLILVLSNILFVDRILATPSIFLHSPYGSQLMGMVNRAFNMSVRNRMMVGGAIEAALSIPMNSRIKVATAVSNAIRRSKGVTTGELSIAGSIHAKEGKYFGDHTMQKITTDKGSFVYEMQLKFHLDANGKKVNSRIFENDKLKYFWKEGKFAYRWSEVRSHDDAFFDQKIRYPMGEAVNDNYYAAEHIIHGIPLPTAQDALFHATFISQLDAYGENIKTAGKNTCCAVLNESLVLGGAPAELAATVQGQSPAASDANPYESLSDEEKGYYLTPDQATQQRADSWVPFKNAVSVGSQENSHGIETQSFPGVRESINNGIHPVYD